jgi:hypothetical protein
MFFDQAISRAVALRALLPGKQKPAHSLKIPDLACPAARSACFFHPAAHIIDRRLIPKPFCFDWEVNSLPSEGWQYAFTNAILNCTTV